jgi:hypothetical protein
MLLFLGAALLVFGLYTLLAGATSGPPQGVVRLGAPRVDVTPLGSWLGGTLSLLWSFGLLLSGLQLVALGTVFRLFIHLEENTRATAQILDKIRLRMETSGAGAEPLFRS